MEIGIKNLHLKIIIYNIIIVLEDESIKYQHFRPLGLGWYVCIKMDKTIKEDIVIHE